MVEHENKLNQLEEKEQLRNAMVHKTNLIVFELDRQEQHIRSENIIIQGVEENKEDNDDGEKILFKVADPLKLDLQVNDIQTVHRLGQKRRNKENPRPIIASLFHTKQETSFVLTNGNSKVSKEDSTSSFVKISHFYGTSYRRTCRIVF